MTAVTACFESCYHQWELPLNAHIMESLNAKIHANLNFRPARRHSLQNISSEWSNPWIWYAEPSTNQKLCYIEFKTSRRKIFATTRIRIFGQKFGENAYLGLLVAVTEKLKKDFEVCWRKLSNKTIFCEYIYAIELWQLNLLVVTNV